MGNIRNNILKIAALAMLVVSLVLAMAAPALAANPNDRAAGALHTVQGKVIGVPGTSSFAVQNENQTAVTITVDNTTRYYIISMGKAQSYVNSVVNQDNKQAKKDDKKKPSVAADLKKAHIPANWKENLGWLETFDRGAGFADIKVGDRVIARTTSDSTNLAKQIMLIKAPVIQQVKGTITAVSATLLTVTPSSETAVALTLDGNTKVSLKGIILVQTGQYAVVTYNRNSMIAQAVTVTAAAPAAAPAAAFVRTLSSIALAPVSPASLPVGSTQQFTATATYSNGTTGNITSQVTWNSSNVSAATISSTGLASAIAAGSTVITATQAGIASPAVNLIVTVP